MLHQGRYLTFRIDTVERADGSRAERDVAGHPGAVAIVAIDDDDQVLLVRQFRSPAERVLLEIPAGTLDVDPATRLTEDPDLAARRELEEETGYRAATWQRLASFWTAPGFATELMHLYLATGLRPADSEERLGPDEDEHLRLEPLPWAAAIAAAMSGQIADAKSLVGLLWVERRRAEAASDAGEPAVPGRRPLIERTFTFRVTEILLASMLTMRRSRVVQVFGLVIAGLSVPPLLAGELAVAAPGLIVAILFFTGLFAVPFALVAAWRYRERLLQPTTISVTERGFEYRSTNTHSDTAWASFSRLQESSGFLLVELGPQTLIVPLRIFTPEERAAIRRLAAEAGFGPDGRPRRKAG